ncbi:MAG: response regulator [Deltaproteobacteria bacterium]|nr:response regulator [Deltaproteobacteria bacterium]MBP7289426.1 response regulator [Nannocystaceae bacterium]
MSSVSIPAMESSPPFDPPKVERAAILIVDDDARNILALEAMLADLGLEIVSAVAVDDALRQLLLHDFALILLDIQMPGMNGVELARIIRSRERTRRVPIMFLTAFDHGDEYVAKGYAVGAVDFLFKPPVPEILRSKVMGLVELYRKTKEIELQAAQLRAAEREAHERRLAEFRASMEAATLRSEMAASRRMNERLQLLADVATELLSCVDPIDAVHGLAPKFNEHLGFDVFAAYQQLGAAGELRRIGSAGGDETVPAVIEIDDAHPSVRHVIDDRARWITEDATGEEGTPPWLVATGVRSAVVLPVVARGRAVGLVACGRRSPGAIAPEDISAVQVVCEQIAMALDRDHLMRSLREHADALSDAHRRKDEFLAMLAHELRNPLAPMCYALDMLQQRESDDETERLQAVMGRQLSHLNRMVDDLLDVSRITSGKIELVLGPVSLNEILRSALETSRPLIERNRHRVELAPFEPDVTLVADATRLTQVVANLVNNAARYTDPGGEIRVLTESGAGQVRIRVEDNGRGIPSEVLPRVFDLFVQAARTSDRSQGGLGLGLTLVRRLIEMHGGTVSAVSPGPDLGSTFVVTLPLGDEQPALPATVQASPARAIDHGRGLAVLVVEDNEDSREMLQLLLEARGHRVVVAADGHAGLAEILTARHDVALLDIGLPGLDGYEVAQRVRSQCPNITTRLIAITGYGQGEDRERALTAGFDEHLVKPVSVTDLERVLQPPS